MMTVGPLLRIASLLALSSLGGCGTGASSDPLLIRTSDFISAYNAGDLDRMMVLLDQDIRWLSIDGASMSVEAEGRVALRTAMADYFAAGSRAPSRMRFMRRDGEFVIGVEEIMRAQSGIGKNRCSVVVYRFEKTLIAAVWYYHPAYPC